MFFGPHPHRAQLLGVKGSDYSSSSSLEENNALSEARKEGKSLRLTKTPLVELAGQVSKSESDSNGLTDATCWFNEICPHKIRCFHPLPWRWMRLCLWQLPILTNPCLPILTKTRFKFDTKDAWTINIDCLCDIWKCETASANIIKSQTANVKHKAVTFDFQNRNLGHRVAKSVAWYVVQLMSMHKRKTETQNLHNNITQLSTNMNSTMKKCCFTTSLNPT